MEHPGRGSEGTADRRVEKGLDRRALKARMKRFARIRAAERVLPSALIRHAGPSEEEIAALRGRLTDLGSDPTLSREGLVEALHPVDRELERMAAAVLARCDALEFGLLRSTILRALISHRREVLSLLEVLLEDRDHVLARLPKIEYLITILSTEEIQNRRSIVHDPVSLTPLLAHFDRASADSTLMDSIAMELYQAANAYESETSINDLRQLRNRKAQLGVQALSANMLRAVVTYNARIFNRMEDSIAASRACDADLESLLDPILDETSEGAEAVDCDLASDDDEFWNSIGREPNAGSVFESDGIARVIEASRRRLNGIPIGSCSSERVALTLDMSLLDVMETQAIEAAAPDEVQSILAHTAVVGLVLRDLGAVRSDLMELRVDLDELTGAWVRELGEAFTRIVSEKLADGTQYKIASTLSGIKTKHLLAPLVGLNNAAGRSVPEAIAVKTSAEAESKRLSREAALRAKARSESQAAQEAAQRSGWESWSPIRKMGVLAAVVPLMFFLTYSATNLVGTEPDTVDSLVKHDLYLVSPHLKWAYRSEKEDGALLIGRVDNEFVRLGPAEKLEAVEAMRKNWEKFGVREVMAYDDRNRLQILFVGGELLRPPS